MSLLIWRSTDFAELSAPRQIFYTSHDSLKTIFKIRGGIEEEEQKDRLSFFNLIPQIDAALVNG